MSFNDNYQLDTSQVEGGGSGGGGGFSPGGMVIGGGGGLGILGIIAWLLMSVLGGNSSDGSSSVIPQQQAAGQVQDGSAGSGSFSQCKTGIDANQDTTCRIVATVNSVQSYWAKTLPEQANGQYTKAKTVIYNGRTKSACGTASNDVGPFYCPTDRKVYIDPTFYDELTQRFGSSSGKLAQEYVVAHEYGHHVENQLGLLERAQNDQQGAQSGSVRIELMADCLAGMWAKGATETKDAAGNAAMKPLTETDIKDALSAAAAVGDDHIQSSMGRGGVNPDTWTHGSSAARQRWFSIGYKYGDLNKCNTFAVDKVE